MPRKPGAKAIVAYRGKMLLILRDNNQAIPFPNTWNTPGGGIEEGESLEDAIRRELAEEILVVPQNLDVSDMITYDDQSIVYRFFSILSPDEYAKVALGDEGQRLDWFAYEDAMALDLSPDLRIYFEKKKDAILDLLRRSEER